MIHTLKAIPETLESDLRAYLYSDNFQAFSFASDIVKSIQVNDPDLIEFLPQKDISKAIMMNRLTSSGIPPEQAFNQINKSFQSINENIMDQRAKTFNKMLGDPKFQKKFEASTMRTGWFFWKENCAYAAKRSPCPYQRHRPRHGHGRICPVRCERS